MNRVGLPRISTLALVAATTTALTLTTLPRVAEACGGMFCDAGPQIMPVDQTGENILFAIDRAAQTVEVHIQIQYTGDAANFSWIIPVTSVPETSVGSEQLFQNLLSATVPSFQLQFQQDCAEDDNDGSCNALRGANQFSAFESDGGGTDSGGSPTGLTAGTDEPPVNVVDRAIVGPYFVEILETESADDLYTWLSDNGYAQDEDAPPIVQEYLDEGHLFAAVKLFNGADTDEIQPLVMKYSGTEPCVPLRLTRIAAVNDMPIRVFFLGDARAAPSNYRHVLVNPARIDWINQADNYNDVIAMAVDGEGKTEGRAFVTEYAGDSSVVQTAGLYNEAWEQADFRNNDSPIITGGYTVIDALEGAQLLDCNPGYQPGCQYFHPMIEPLLQQYVPPPDGVAQDDYYRNMLAFEELVDLEAWDGVAFSDAIDERILNPGLRAIELLNTWPYLTRMFTRISPHEMMEDPIFHENPDLPDVSNFNTALLEVPCRGSQRVTFANDDFLLLNEDGTWPKLPKGMPWAQAVQKIAMKGAPNVEHDFREVIATKLAQSNDNFDYDNGEGACTVRPHAPGARGVALMGLILAIAWRGRRRARA